MSLNIRQIVKKTKSNQYEKRIQLLQKEKGFDTSNIEDVVREVTHNVFKQKCKALVVFFASQPAKFHKFQAAADAIVKKPKGIL